jgi:hypothetical protein
MVRDKKDLLRREMRDAQERNDLMTLGSRLGYLLQLLREGCCEKDFVHIVPVLIRDRNIPCRLLVQPAQSIRQRFRKRTQGSVLR